MTELRFQISPGIIPKPLLEKAFFACWGRAPRPTQTEIVGNELIVRSNTKGSGTVHVLWPHKRLGLVVESTDSLLSANRRYLLMKELGRGALGRLLKKLFEWQILGFRPTPEIRQEITLAARRFSKAVISDPYDPVVEQEFADILRELDRLSMEVAQAYTEQSLAWRLRGNKKLTTFFGIGINDHPLNSTYEFDLYAPFLQEAFQAVLPMPSWRELEPEPDQFRWSLLERRISIPDRFGFQTVMGPLLSFDSMSLPTWLPPRLTEEGFLETRATRFVNALAERYASVTSHWILASRFNSYTNPDLPLARSIMLVRLLSQQLRSRGVETPILVGIDRPWGEYALEQVPEYDQVQIAESLIGCHEIDSFLMELNFGLDHRSTLPRDPMAISTMIDQWSFLGKKIYISLSIPSEMNNHSLDPVAQLGPEFTWSEGLQLSWTEMLLNTLLGKRMVQGIFWSLLQDSAQGEEDTQSLSALWAPYSGLIDSSRVLKLAFKQFVSIRKTMLKAE